MCGRLVNLDTVARVIADYYHLKTDTQLAALDEALSRVPAETVGKELFGISEQLESGHEKGQVADPGKMVGDLINRQVAVDAVNSLIDRFELILSDIRESTVDDSVCGMCEYDGAFVGQSGDWCNECPGFEKDNCFKLSDECRKRWLDSVELPSAQPDIVACGDCIHWICHDRRCGYWNHGVKPLDWCCHAERGNNG